MQQAFIWRWCAFQPQSHLTTKIVNRTTQKYTLQIYFIQHKDDAIYIIFNRERDPLIVSHKNSKVCPQMVCQYRGWVIAADRWADGVSAVVKYIIDIHL